MTFDFDPQTYTPENWNAVILYNYIDMLRRGELYPRTQEEGFTDTFEFIKQLLKEHYDKQKLHILDFDKKCDEAIRDIKEYNYKLDVSQEIHKYFLNNTANDE